MVRSRTLAREKNREWEKEGEGGRRDDIQLKVSIERGIVLTKNMLSKFDENLTIKHT